jgi:hypothetical protein
MITWVVYDLAALEIVSRHVTFDEAYDAARLYSYKSACQVRRDDGKGSH